MRQHRPPTEHGAGRRARCGSGRSPGAARLRRQDPEKCTPNSGDTAWMLTSMAIVLMMTIPGPGAVLRRHGAQEERRRHRDDELRHHLPDQYSVAVVHLQHRVPRRLAVHRRVRSRVLQGIVSDINDRHRQSPNSLAPTIPETVYSMFQLTFAIITAALIAGLVCRAHEVLGHAVVHRRCGRSSSIRRSLIGCGDRTASSTAPMRTPNSTCSTSPAARSCTSIRAPPA